jgi:hypothetical protein
VTLVAASQIGLTLHVDCFDAAAVRHFCLPWLMGPVCFLSACPCSDCAVVCLFLAAYFMLVGTSVADHLLAVSASDRVFAAGLLCSCLCPLWLPPLFREAGSCLSPLSAPLGWLKPKPHWVDSRSG